jgi:Ca2+-binding EF-hand superfamily protein
MKFWWAFGCLVVSGALVLAPAQGGDREKKKGDFEGFFKHLDANMDGKLSRDEFLKMAERAKDKTQARQKLSEAYDKIDPDGKGIEKGLFKKYLDERKKQ